MILFGTAKFSSVTEDLFLPGSKKSSNTTRSSARPITVFGPWNTGIVHWRKQKREAVTSRVEAFLTQHGSTRLDTGPIQYLTKIRFTCSVCNRPMQSNWSNLL